MLFSVGVCVCDLLIFLPLSSSELEAVRKQYPFENLRYSRPALRMHYKEAVALLREHGPAVGAAQVASLHAEVAAAAAAGDDERVREMAKTVPDAEVRIYIYIGTYLSIHHVYRDAHLDIAIEIDVYIGLTRARARDGKDRI